MQLPAPPARVPRHAGPMTVALPALFCTAYCSTNVVWLLGRCETVQWSVSPILSIGLTLICSSQASCAVLEGM